MSFPWNSTQSGAVTRLSSTYNGGVYNSVSNPGGLAQGGHIPNFIPALQDLAVAGQAAADAATAAGQQAGRTAGTSSSSVAIGTGTKTFTTQADKMFDVGSFQVIRSAAAPTTNWMFGQVATYSGTTLTMDVQATGGSGTFTDWLISLSGARGVVGPQGPSGTIAAGTGTSLAPGSTPTVTNVGTSTAAIFNFGVPRGDTGPAAAGARIFSTMVGINGATIPSIGSGGPAVITAMGNQVEGDCPPMIMTRVATATKPYDGFVTAVDAAGQKWELLAVGGRVHFSQFGAPHDDFTDTVGNAADTHFAALRAYLWEHAGNKTGPLPTLYSVDVGGTEWYFRDTLRLKTATEGGVWTLYVSPSSAAHPNGAFRFDKRVTHGMIIDDVNTLGGVAESTPTFRGNDGTVIDGILFWRLKDTASDRILVGNGIYQKGRADITNCQFVEWPGDAIFSNGDNSSGNTDCSYYDNLYFQYNWDAAMHFRGAIANACRIGMISCTENYGNAVRDDSFLGNHYESIHSENTALYHVTERPWGVIAHNNAAWECIASPGDSLINPGRSTAAATTEPGTNSDVWSWLYDDSTAATYLTSWVSGGDYRSNGSIVLTNFAAEGIIKSWYGESGEHRIELSGTNRINQGGYHDGIGTARNSSGIFETKGVRWNAGNRTYTRYSPTNPHKGTEYIQSEWNTGVGVVFSFVQGYPGSTTVDSPWKIVHTGTANDYNLFAGKLLGTNTPHGTDASYKGTVSNLADRQMYYPSLRLGRDPYSRKIEYVENRANIQSGGVGDLFFLEQATPGTPKIIECITAGTFSSGTLVFRVVAHQQWLEKDASISVPSLAPGASSSLHEKTGVTGAGGAFVVWANAGGDSHGIQCVAWTFSNSIFYYFHNPANNPAGTNTLGTVDVFFELKVLVGGYGV
jgi:hypothetical protein